MLVEKLQSVDAFVVFDLEDAPHSVGIVRSAPKILVDGATWLARSQTYQWASFEFRVGGASAGVNAAPPDRIEAVQCFVREVQPWVAARRLVVEPGKGVDPDTLAPLLDSDPRPAAYWERADSLAAAGIVASASVALGDLDGCAFAIEGFGRVGLELAGEVARRGGRVVAVSTAAGTAHTPEGFQPSALDAAWSSRGDDLVHELQSEPDLPGAVFGASVDVLVCGSRAGVVDHGVAAACSAKAVVPSGPIPVTAKGLAVLQRAGVRVLPDFVTTAGPTLGGVAPALFDTSAPSAEDVQTTIGAVLTDVLDHEDGPVLAACRRAEAFMRTWRTDLPFGRPLA